MLPRRIDYALWVEDEFAVTGRYRTASSGTSADYARTGPRLTDLSRICRDCGSGQRVSHSVRSAGAGPPGALPGELAQVLDGGRAVGAADAGHVVIAGEGDLAGVPGHVRG